MPASRLPAIPDAAMQRAASANKVPAVTAVFWIIKVLSTTVDETGRILVRRLAIAS